MTYAERAHRWNAWYDDLPDRWRFQVVLWPLLVVGTINMMLTIGNGFPFGLLVLLAIIALAIVRLPYKAGMVRARPGTDAGPSAHGEAAHEQTVHLGRVDWAWNLNQKYDALPEWRRFWIFPAVLIVAGAINMALTLGNGFPFGLLFLLALLVMVAIRAPYVWGWLTPPGQDAPDLRRVGHDTTPAIPSFAAPAPKVEAAPIGTGDHAAHQDDRATHHDASTLRDGLRAGNGSGGSDGGAPVPSFEDPQPRTIDHETPPTRHPDEPIRP